MCPGQACGSEDASAARPIAAPAAGTTVMVHHASTYQRDGRVVTAGGAARPDASALVRQFLVLMQERKLDEARKLLAPGFEMVFPGGKPMNEFSELLAWAKTRYPRIGKHFERFDEVWGEEGTVVYCTGTLEGVWLDGRPCELQMGRSSSSELSSSQCS
jgi:hypothetical protein